jgi:uncharacterized Tic20 family protein
VDEHGKLSLNFQLSLTVFFLLVVVLAVLMGSFFLGLLLPVGGIAFLYGVVMAIVNGVRAHNGDEAAYALSTRFLR